MPSLRDFQAQTQTVYDGIFDIPSKLTVYRGSRDKVSIVEFQAASNRQENLKEGKVPAEEDVLVSQIARGEQLSLL